MLQVRILEGLLNPLFDFYKENLVGFGFVFLASIFSFGKVSKHIFKFLYESFKTFTIGIVDDLN